MLMHEEGFHRFHNLDRPYEVPASLPSLQSTFGHLYSNVKDIDEASMAGNPAHRALTGLEDPPLPSYFEEFGISEQAHYPEETYYYGIPLGSSIQSQHSLPRASQPKSQTHSENHSTQMSKTQTLQASRQVSAIEPRLSYEQQPMNMRSLSWPATTRKEHNPIWEVPDDDDQDDNDQDYSSKSESEEEHQQRRVHRRRISNRQTAKRLREKNKERLTTLTKKLHNLQSEQTTMKYKIHKLKEEKVKFRLILESHKVDPRGCVLAAQDFCSGSAPEK